ncbi:hypothetical protein WN51_07189 [Melipona quadrifasciata]|uniref:Uncharacterized protein n=1 Tax=Melipona quadrifasciata TaxID=166423 RepID=A0A0M9A856_9HYME|nr:hypothetical protein WN51_07189 [Melipona quadrifasciata]
MAATWQNLGVKGRTTSGPRVCGGLVFEKVARATARAGPLSWPMIFGPGDATLFTGRMLNSHVVERSNSEEFSRIEAKEATASYQSVRSRGTEEGGEEEASDRCWLSRISYRFEAVHRFTSGPLAGDFPGPPATPPLGYRRGNQISFKYRGQLKTKRKYFKASKYYQAVETSLQNSLFSWLKLANKRPGISGPTRWLKIESGNAIPAWPVGRRINLSPAFPSVCWTKQRPGGARSGFRWARRRYRRWRQKRCSVDVHPKWRWNVGGSTSVHAEGRRHVACKSFTRVCVSANEPEQATWRSFDVGTGACLHAEPAPLGQPCTKPVLPTAYTSIERAELSGRLRRLKPNPPPLRPRIRTPSSRKTGRFIRRIWSKLQKL